MMRNKKIINEIKRLQEIMGIEVSKPLLMEQPILGKIAKSLGLLPSNVVSKVAKNYPDVSTLLSKLSNKSLGEVEKVGLLNDLYGKSVKNGITDITKLFDDTIQKSVKEMVTNVNWKRTIESQLTAGKNSDEIYSSIYRKTANSGGDIEKAFKKSFIESVDEMAEKMVKNSPTPKTKPNSPLLMPPKI